MESQLPHLKMKPSGRLIGLLLMALVVRPGIDLAAAGAAGAEMRTTIEWSYPMGSRDTPAVARALALFGARSAAVRQSAALLADKGLLKDYADKQREIYCLAADEVLFAVVDEAVSAHTYTIRIDARLSLAGFVRAEIRNAALEEEEMHFSWKKEMEPQLSPTIDPAAELSRAYRYLRQRRWRMAIIYLDHLEGKYPQWGDLFFAKGLGYRHLNETEQALQAFAQACAYGHPEACRPMPEAEGLND